MNIELSKQDQYVIAEYIYSYKSDILIISDATDLISSLESNKLISESLAEEYRSAVKRKDARIAIILAVKLQETIPAEQREEIMNAYFKGQLP